jgi:alpha-glucuronidase
MLKAQSTLCAIAAVLALSLATAASPLKAQPAAQTATAKTYVGVWTGFNLRQLPIRNNMRVVWNGGSQARWSADLWTCSTFGEKDVQVQRTGERFSFTYQAGSPTYCPPTTVTFNLKDGQLIGTIEGFPTTRNFVLQESRS